MNVGDANEIILVWICCAKAKMHTYLLHLPTDNIRYRHIALGGVGSDP